MFEIELSFGNESLIEYRYGSLTIRISLRLLLMNFRVIKAPVATFMSRGRRVKNPL